MIENNCFEYCIDPTAEEPIMLILKHIGNAYDEHGNITEYGIQGADFCRELLLLDSAGKRKIQVWINSIGGSVIDGYSILGAMLKTKASVDTYNIGVAASTAGWLFEAGQNRDMSDYATWMGHNPHSQDGDDPEILQKFRDSIVKIISERTALPLDETAEMLDKETYLTASQCLVNGFCDTITVTSRKNSKRMQQAASINDKWSEALLINNSVIPKKFLATQKTQDMAVDNKIDVTITNKLALDADASPAMVAGAIQALQNKLRISETNLAGITNAKDDLEITKTDLQRKYDNLKRELDKLKNDMEEEDCRNREEAAKHMVNEFVGLGKIVNKAEEIQAWVDDAMVSKEAFNKVKNRLTNLPVNKEARKLPVTIDQSITMGAGGPKNADQRMLSIARKHGQRK